MAWKVVRISARRTSQFGRTGAEETNKYEQEVMDKIGATMEIASLQRGATEKELLSVCRDADIVITGAVPFTRNVIEHLEKCRALVSMAVGYEGIDAEAATDCGVLVINNADFNAEEVSDHAMALLLTLAKKVVTLNKLIHERAGTAEFATALAKARERGARLRGQTLGLVGLGGIPRLLVPKARGFAFRIIAYDPYVPAEVAKEIGVELVDFDRLLEESDYISVHANLTPENRHMFGLKQFKKMKPTAFFINTARGGLVDEQALYTALTEGYLAGAGLEVTEVEPVPADNPLLKLENVILTGHSGWLSETSLANWDKAPIEDIARILSGEWPRARALKNPEAKKKYTQRWGSPSSG